MKSCQNCGNQNSDDMRFCLQCGKPLPDAPIVFNLQDSGTQKQSAPSTSPYNQSVQTQVGKGFNQNQFSMVPPPAKRNNNKIFLAVGGVLVLILLLFLGVGAIVGYNLLVKNDPTPTPTPSKSGTPTPSPSNSSTPTPTRTPTPTPTDTPTKSSGDPSATFDDLWVDYNVFEGGQKGMRIHVSFKAKNMKDVESYLSLNFMKKDGTKLTSSSSKYSNNGNVALLYSLKPGYDPAVFEDIKLFIPYDELNLKSGKYDLKIDTDVTYRDGDLINHLNFYEFEFTQP